MIASVLVKSAILIPVIGVNFLELASMTVFAQTHAEPPAGGYGSILGQALILLTTIATFVYNLYREKRQRKWDLEDRRLAREEQARRTTEVKDAITENTNVTVAAAVQADAANRKIAELRRLFEGEAADTLEAIDEKTTETVERLRNAQKGVRKDGPADSEEGDS